MPSSGSIVSGESHRHFQRQHRAVSHLCRTSVLCVFLLSRALNAYGHSFCGKPVRLTTDRVAHWAFHLDNEVLCDFSRGILWVWQRASLPEYIHLESSLSYSCLNFAEIVSIFCRYCHNQTNKFNIINISVFSWPTQI